MGSRQSFATPHSHVPSAMIGQYTLKPDTHSNRDTGTSGSVIFFPINAPGMGRFQLFDLVVYS